MNRIDAYEWLAGKLLVRSARLRARRMDPDDAHEFRHLHAAILAGNSSPCDHGASCHLDRALMERLHFATFPACDFRELRGHTLSGEPNQS